MGKRGPKKTPTAVLRARGSWRAGDRGDEVRPLAITEIQAPEICHKNARVLYNRFAQELRDLGLFTKNDTVALACFCNALLQYKELQDLIDTDGVMIWSKKGKKMHPAFQAQRNIYTELCKGFSQFGMTPADRAGLCATIQEVQSNAQGQKETKASLFKLA